MDLGMPDKEGPFSITTDNPILNRSYKDFVFNGSLEEDKNILTAFQKSLRHQNTVKDTVNGIKIHFGRQMKYEVFIRILDILVEEDTPTYIPYKNQMLVVIGSKSDGEWQRKKLEKELGVRFSEKPMSCGNPAYQAEQRALERENRERMEMENFRESYFKDHRYLFLAYFGLALLNIYMLIKFNRNRIYIQKSYI